MRLPPLIRIRRPLRRMTLPAISSRARPVGQDDPSGLRYAAVTPLPPPRPAVRSGLVGASSPRARVRPTRSAAPDSWSEPRSARATVRLTERSSSKAKVTRPGSASRSSLGADWRWATKRGMLRPLGAASPSRSPSASASARVRAKVTMTVRGRWSGSCRGCRGVGEWVQQDFPVAGCAALRDGDDAAVGAVLGGAGDARSILSEAGALAGRRGLHDDKWGLRAGRVRRRTTSTVTSPSAEEMSTVVGVTLEDSSCGAAVSGGDGLGLAVGCGDGLGLAVGWGDGLADGSGDGLADGSGDGLADGSGRRARGRLG